MFKSIVITLVIILTMTVSINANVSIINYIDSNVDIVNDIDVVAASLDNYSEVVEYVGDSIVYTPANVWWAKTNVNVCVEQVTNINNNTIVNNNDVVVDNTSSVVAIDNSVVDDTYTHSIAVDNVYTSTVSVHTTTPDVQVVGQASAVTYAVYADIYTVDYAYYTVVVPNTSIDSVQYVDATCMVVNYIASCDVEHENAINTSTWVAVETSNLSLPYRRVSIVKKWLVVPNIRAGSQLKLLLFESARCKPLIYSGHLLTSRNTLLRAVC